ISPIVGAADLNYYAINNSFDNGSVRTNHGFSASDKWTVLNTDRPIAGVGDIALTFGKRNINVKSGPAHLTYIISFGQDLPSAKNAIVEAAGILGVRGNVPPHTNTSFDVHLWPDPAQEVLHVSSTAEGPLLI